MRNNQESPERPVSGRERLALAAQKLFRNESYGAVSISCILDECGLKAPALYHHYGDKEGIYLSWSLHAIKELGERIDRAITLNTGRDTAHALAESLLKDPLLDILILERDIPKLQRPASRNQMLRALEISVYKPIETWLVTNRSPKSEAPRLARFIVHSLSLGLPVYGGDQFKGSEGMHWLVERVFSRIAAGSPSPPASPDGKVSGPCPT